MIVVNKTPKEMRAAGYIPTLQQGSGYNMLISAGVPIYAQAIGTQQWWWVPGWAPTFVEQLVDQTADTRLPHEVGPQVPQLVCLSVADVLRSSGNMAEQSARANELLSVVLLGGAAALSETVEGVPNEDAPHHTRPLVQGASAPLKRKRWRRWM